MRIIVPSSNLEFIPQLCDVGADDIYIGFYDDMWQRKYGTFSEINRMSSFGEKANILSSDIPKAIQIVQSKGKKIYITLNSPAYSKTEIRTLIELLDKYQMWKCDGFITADMTLTEILMQHGSKIKLSTMAGAYNRMILSFYAEMGIRDIIFPRDVSIAEMQEIIRLYPDIDFEAFLMRNGCRYSDSNCLMFHDRGHGAMCAWIDQSPCVLSMDANEQQKNRKEFYSNNHLFRYALLKKACGLCAVKDLMDIGIRSVKIVGRADRSAGILKDIQSVRDVIDHNGVINHDAYYESCLYGLNCYY